MSVETKKDIESANEIFVRRARKLLVPPESIDSPASEAHVASFVRNLESVGFVVSQELVESCARLSLIDLTALNDDALRSIRKSLGAHRQLKPMYPNFPSQVMQMSDARLYMNAFLHYITGGRYVPATAFEPRPRLAENTRMAHLAVGSQKEFESIFTRLASSNTSLSQQDKDDLAWFIAHLQDDIVRLLPKKIPNREVRAVLCARLIEHTEHAKSKVFELCDTATDVLRLATALSNGDVSLAAPCKFRSFKRSERRLLFSILSACKTLTEDMLRWKGRWIRLGERLHPGEYRRQYPQVVDSFDVLRKNLPADTFNGQLERAFEMREMQRLLKMMQGRPGDFARRLDHVLRLSSPDFADAINAFKGVAQRVSTPVLLQVMHHFSTRNSLGPIRVFLPKGEVAKAQAIANKLPPLPDSVCQSMANLCSDTLVERFRKLPPLGKCFIGKELKNFLVPFSQRSASKSLRTAARGSRLPLPPVDTLRFFIWWKNGKSRTDLDLSAVMFDKDFAYIAAVAFYSLKLKEYGGCHSGDIVDAPEGASEFIDVSIGKCLEGGVRYVVMAVNSYTAQPYCDLPECFAGWMGRLKADSGEIYEPKTVQDKLDISSNAKIAIPAIFDLSAGEVIWADLALTRWPFWFNTVAANLWGIQLTLRSMVELRKPNLYDLFNLHVAARGELVSEEKDAQTVFSVSNGTPFDLTRIACDFMST